MSFNYEDFATYKTATAAGETKKAARYRNKLVTENQGLVRKFVGKMQKRGVIVGEEEDLMQAGLIGLDTAVQRYNPEKGRFSTYAAHWVRHEVQKASLAHAMIYRPKGSGLPYQAHRKAEAIMAAENRDATAAEMGVSQELLDRWHQPPNCYSMYGGSPSTKAGQAKMNRGESNESSSMDEILTSDDPGPEAYLEEAELLAHLSDAMSVLDPREHRIIRALFVEGKTYPEVAEEEHRHPESIRLIRVRALEKLRDVLDPEV